MRTIKFRALSMCKGECWVYGDVRHYNRNPKTEKWTIHDPYTGIETDVEPETIGQFTGLYDCKGREIYEGDLIGRCKSNHYLEVRFIDGIFRLCGLDDKVGYGSIPANYLMNKINLVLEVVGNIHENPEFIKGGEK